MPYSHPRGLVLAIAFGALHGCAPETAADLEATVFDRLTEARTEQGGRVLSHLQSLWDKAVTGETDPVLSAAFAGLYPSRQDRPTGRRDPGLIASLEERYVLEYGEFYDILFRGQRWPGLSHREDGV